MLLQHLPRESAYVQAVVGESARWGDTEHLLAGVIDVIQVGNYLTTRAHFKGKQPQPKPVRRPGDKPDAKMGGKGRSVAEMRKILDNWGAGASEEFTTEVK